MTAALQKKICMLGGFSVGKTSLVKRYVQSVFSETYLTTVGVKIDKKTVELPDRIVNLILWDLEGELTYPWLTSNEHAYMGDNSALRRSYLPPEYRRDTALHNVIATVHIEAECDRRRQVEEVGVDQGVAEERKWVRVAADEA